MYVIRNKHGLVDVCLDKSALYHTTFEMSLRERGAVYVTYKSTVSDLIRDLEGMGYKVTKCPRKP